MAEFSHHKYYPYLLICLNITLQILAFCLMKFAWIYAHHSLWNLINFFALLAFTITISRAVLWQYILKVQDLTLSYLPNAIVPSLLVLAGYSVFNEKITFFNIIGTLIVLSGLILLMKSKPQP